MPKPADRNPMTLPHHIKYTPKLLKSISSCSYFLSFNKPLFWQLIHFNCRITTIVLENMLSNRIIQLVPPYGLEKQFRSHVCHNWIYRCHINANRGSNEWIHCGLSMKFENSSSLLHNKYQNVHLNSKLCPMMIGHINSSPFMKKYFSVKYYLLIQKALTLTQRYQVYYLLSYPRHQ